MARYKLNDARDYLAALDYINQAKEQGFDIELKRYSPKRTSRQNAYLHLILSYFAHCYNCTLIEAKEIYFKKYACGEIFQVITEDKNGQRVEYYRSTTDLTTVEMQSAIANFRAYADMHGIGLPDPNDDISLRYCERQVEKTQAYGT